MSDLLRILWQLPEGRTGSWEIRKDLPDVMKKIADGEDLADLPGAFMYEELLRSLADAITYESETVE